ncbi:MAG: 50S ribosomal protein L35 [Bdellovibrionales bacterium]|nr:50S ribosomal protein L35 [Bdellovibrionales bacterium]
MGTKLKTHSGAKKRFTKTASGKIKRKKAGGRHLNIGKGGTRLRRLKGSAYVFEGDVQRVHRLLPNS